MHVAEPEGREVLHDRALDADPDRPRAAPLRRRDARAAGGALRRARALGRDDRTRSSGRASTSLVPSFTGSTMFTLEVPCTYDLEVASAKYFDSLSGRRRAAELPLQRHRALPRRPTTGCRSCSCRGAAPRSWRMPVDVWKRTIAAHYPGGGWIRLQHETLEALARAKASAGCTRSTTTVRELL